MKEIPILFSGPMVRAILEGRKTQTRRIVKEPTQYNQAIKALDGSCSHKFVKRFGNGVGMAHSGWVKCPLGKPGDRLWVKETWQYYGWTEDGEPFIRYAADGKSKLKHVNNDDWAERIWDIFYDLSAPENYNIDNHARDRRWRPSIYMPRWASRITLRITGIRVERLQDISDDNARAEGIAVPAPPPGGGYTLPIPQFRNLWDSIYGKRPGSSWNDNPWVWVVGFERI